MFYDMVGDDSDDEDDDGDDSSSGEDNIVDEDSASLASGEDFTVPRYAPDTPIKKYTGHRSSDTIKGVGFFGPRSEYVVSGSDDSRAFMWDRDTGRLVRVLEGHETVVNCVVGHPHLPVLATSGIDVVTKIWEPTETTLDEGEVMKRHKRMNAIARANKLRLQEEGSGARGTCSIQ
eukprot:TRINITY_DN9471_c1_g2_i3.p1 TRINITY_DN9471_c1_g2~~TRINITY_DN9471_c1_g2_i3.p1  ORF type:complete len:176 (+),score=44.18 TRINITY_DN9471_c1_g2_i3:497-1024(+)